MFPICYRILSRQLVKERAFWNFRPTWLRFKITRKIMLYLNFSSYVTRIFVLHFCFRVTQLQRITFSSWKNPSYDESDVIIRICDVTFVVTRVFVTRVSVTRVSVTRVFVTRVFRASDCLSYSIEEQPTQNLVSCPNTDMDRQISFTVHKVQLSHRL